MLEQLNAARRNIDVSYEDIRVRELVRMVEEGELNASPEYQRKFRWTVEDECRLIESLMLGLPVPPLFFANNQDYTSEVVDGLQRLSSVVHFLDPTEVGLSVISRDAPLRLEGLEQLSELNGNTYRDLPTEVQRHFARSVLRVTYLTDKSDDRLRFELFERLNRGAVRLSPQEVRQVLYRGEFSDLIKELAGLAPFQRIVRLPKDREQDGTREEIVLKFFAYGECRNDFDGQVTLFLNQFMKRNRDTTRIEEWRELFDATVSELERVIDTPFVRRDYRRTPVNQLEAVLVAAGDVVRDGDKLQQVGAALAEDGELRRLSTGGTNTRIALLGRIARAHKLLIDGPE